MRRPQGILAIGITLAGVVAFMTGPRPTIRAGQPSPTIATAAVGGAFGGKAGAESADSATVVRIAAPPMSPEAIKTYLKLQEKVKIDFTADTPLEEVKKYIEEITAEKDDPTSGIAFYFDPRGLQDADKTMASTVAISFKRPIPLETSLKLLLAQLGLRHYIQQDGIVVVTNRDADDLPHQADELILDHLSALRDEVRALREEVRLLHRGDPTTPGPGGAAPKGTGTGGGR